MNQIKLIEKINYIVKSFNDNDAKLWNIGTVVYKSWYKIAENIKSVEFYENDYFVIEQVDKNRFKFLINGKDINPIVKKIN